jgi:hypothetical protein
MQRQHVLAAILVVAAVAAVVLWATRPGGRPKPGESGSTTMMMYADPQTGENFEAPLDRNQPPLAPSGKRALYVYECSRHDPPHTWTEPTFHVEATCPECGGIAGPAIRRAPPQKPKP